MDLHEANEAWHNFMRDRAKAGDELTRRKDEIADLQRQLRRDEAEFDQVWRDEKVRRREARDTAVKFELKHGKPVKTLLRELGTKNTVWIYGLKAEVDMGWAPPKDMVVSSAVVDKNNTTTTWEYHDFTGTHSWALSDDRQLIKKHGVIGTPDEGCYFIASNSNFHFISGDKDYYESIPDAEFYKRSEQLEAVLSDTYNGKMKMEPNPYRELDK